MDHHLTGTTVETGSLSEGDVQEMMALFRRCFDVADPETFRKDLAEKQWVIRLTEAESGILKGFSTLTSYPTRFRGRELSIIYSGDTVVSPECWGSSALMRSWLETVVMAAARLPHPIYWFLISSGYKTYRFLPVFFREFYPCPASSTPSETRALIDHLAVARFGDQYDRNTGVVRFRQGATPLREGVAAVDETRLRDPHVRFFLEHNPGHAGGDELACLAEVAPSNFTPAGLRILRSVGIDRI